MKLDRSKLLRPKRMTASTVPFGQATRLPDKSSSGIALVLVLAFLVLITVLVLAFFSSVTTEVSGSKSYANEASSKQLADSTAQIAIGAIRQATSGGSTVAWASQPGMIRTYDSNGISTGYYKLYSSDNMVVTQPAIGTPPSFDPSTDADPLWSGKPALFTDINSPIVTDLTTVFPILDGNAIKSLTKTPAGVVVSAYLGYDANNDGSPDVEGFSIDPLKVSYNAGQPLSATNNPVPMPVKWIYVLKDGSLTTPTGIDATGKIANWATSTKPPTTSNPIAGRIAFWTDDETCKVNLNTASEGTYADSPRLGVESSDDEGTGSLERNQPVKGEYQRYPGHPAMTSLSAVFPSFTKDQIYSLIPRVATGGSNGGTTQTTMDATFVMNSDSDRLYASADEAIFYTDRSKSLIDKATSQRTKFFLTANSRAPEVNLFGKPRISVWPEHVTETPTFRSTYDSVIAFCGTMRTDLAAGKFRYYFQREDCTDPTHDLPAVGTVTGLGRNRMLLDYLKDLTSRSVPGFSGSASATLLQKYATPDVAGILPGTTSERDQILTEMFDYVRATNLNDVNGSTAYAARGGVVPIEDTATGTRGFGRYKTVQGANLLFIGTADPANPDSSGVAVPANKIRTQAMFLPQIFDVAEGSVFNVSSFTVTVEGLENFRWDNGSGMVSMGFPALTTAIIPDKNRFSPTWFDDQAAFGDQIGLREFLCQTDYTQYVSPATLDAPTGPAGGFQFSGGTVTLKVYSTTLGVGSPPLQTVEIKFPPTTAATKFPAPALASNNYVQAGQGPYNLRLFSVRHDASRAATGAFVSSNDVVRSVSATSGDVRLIAARKKTPPAGSTYYPFSPNVKYIDPATPLNGTHDMWTGDGYPQTGSSGNTLVKGGVGKNGFSQVWSDVPLDGVALGKKTAFANGDIPGDWDNGIAELRDGPFINKPDEGDRGQAPANWPYKWKYQIGDRGLIPTLFTPNRQIASPVTFGSLPSGVLADKPWKTLLFRAGPAAHPGLGTPSGGKPPYTILPDHLFLDLFWMPVVEPYPISEPFSTAGKINMNYQIQPFTYINRDTGIRAVLKSEKVISILNNNSGNPYKAHYSGSPAVAGLSRKSVDVDKTLTGFTNRFTAKDIFRSTSEICDLDIIPSDYTGANPYTRASMDTYWSTRLLTGDNCRERPYATIYPRLTTQSNTYTVHFRVQSLKKIAGTSANIWDETKDQVLSEFRGSQLIERYVDANDTTLPDFAAPANSAYSLDSYPDSNGNMISAYKFRVLSSKKFTP